MMDHYKTEAKKPEDKRHLFASHYKEIDPPYPDGCKHINVHFLVFSESIDECDVRQGKQTIYTVHKPKWTFVAQCVDCRKIYRHVRESGLSIPEWANEALRNTKFFQAFHE